MDNIAHVNILVMVRSAGLHMCSYVDLFLTQEENLYQSLRATSSDNHPAHFTFPFIGMQCMHPYPLSVIRASVYHH